MAVNARRTCCRNSPAPSKWAGTFVLILVATSTSNILSRFYFGGFARNSFCADEKAEALLWKGLPTSISVASAVIGSGLPNPLAIMDGVLIPRGNWRNVDMVIGILSGRDNFERRAKVRDTWKKDLNKAMDAGAGKSDIRMRPIFLVGAEYCEIPIAHRSDWFRCQYNCTERNCEDETEKNLHHKAEKNITKKLYEEASEHGDVLLLNVKDFYHNSPHKMATYLAWAATATSAKYVMKIDDDIFLDWRKFEQELSLVATSQNNTDRPFWWGRLRPNEVVYRPQGNEGDRWTLPREQFVSDIYPPFMAGVGSVMHINAARFVAEQYDHLHHELFGEDVALGVWFGGTNVQYLNDRYVFPYAPGYFNECDESRSLLFFETCMLQIAKRFNQYSLPCPGWLINDIINTTHFIRGG